MTTPKHRWETVDPYDGGYHVCKKCKQASQGERPETPCPISDAEYRAVAWLGQAGLYQSRMDAVLNGEQQIQPLSSAEVMEHARRYLYLTRHMQIAGTAQQNLKHTAMNLKKDKTHARRIYNKIASPEALPGEGFDAAIDRAIALGWRALP